MEGERENESTRLESLMEVSTTETPLVKGMSHKFEEHLPLTEEKRRISGCEPSLLA
jgi:hypothetical protein